MILFQFFLQYIIIEFYITANKLNRIGIQIIAPPVITLWMGVKIC